MQEKELQRRSRACSICGSEKSLSEFEKMPKKKFGRGYRCNQCNRERNRTRNHKDYLDRPVANCNYCGTQYRMANKNHMYCSTSCRNHSNFNSNEHKYITALLTKKRREDGLTRANILELLKDQDGFCALSNEPMTMIRGSGQVPTNVSIDRIEAGGSYSKDNIQLVCSAVNSFRRDLSVEDYIDWCTKVHKAAGGRKGGKASATKRRTTKKTK